MRTRCPYCGEKIRPTYNTCNACGAYKASRAVPIIALIATYLIVSVLVSMGQSYPDKPTAMLIFGFAAIAALFGLKQLKLAIIGPWHRGRP